MKTILIQNISGNNNRMFDPNERDGYNDPAIYLKERFYKLGYILKTADKNSLDECEWVLFYEGNSVRPYSGWRGFARRWRAILKGQSLIRNLYAECVKAGMQNKIALFLWEPPSVSQGNWDPKLHEMFPLIFTWHDSYVDGRKFIKINWPQTRQFPDLPRISFDKKKLLVNISMNKFSNHPRELYSARRDAIRYFEQHQNENFDLYGVGWNRPVNYFEKILHRTSQFYPSYRGTLKNKWDVLPQYRFSLCYENIHSEPGWVTEKIFDCMRAGCVPIYWGAPNITDYVDKNAFIDRRRFKSNEELDDYITNVTESEYEQYQIAMEKYLKSDKFELFLPFNFAETIIRALKLKC